MKLYDTYPITLSNSLSGNKEPFEPHNPPLVGLYVCGPTVYNYVHLGNCRTFISFDLIYRYLNHLGYKVRYVRNITDAGHLENDADEGEDKIGKRARLEQLEPMEIVQKYTLYFHKVLEQFNNIPPSIEPTATGHISEQIAMTKTLIDKGMAYEANGSVYFDIKHYNELHKYGELSGRDIEELVAGSRELDAQDEKRDPRDFALWKKASDAHIMQWDSPWGMGFPGWHLECSVMSTKYLGEQFDIHGGGMDLKFPHHECEIAQNKGASGKEPVKYWMHGNMLTLNGKKMSKSTGNTLLPHELFNGTSDVLEKAYSPMVVRFFMMQAHYGSTLDFSSDALNGAEKAFDKLMTTIDQLDELPVSDNSSFEYADIEASFYQAMSDDFNSPVLIARMFETIKLINQIKKGEEKISTADLEKLKTLFHAFVFDVLGLRKEETVAETEDDKFDKAMELLISLRKEAKINRDFATADRIRDELKAAGVELRDSKEGTSYEVVD